MLVLGLLLGVVMVAALFQIVGVTHASIWRETLQDAADSVAYESAVWQAKGMNIIVGVNLIIAVLMAVLIAWRLAMLFLITLNALLVIVCVVSFLFPVLAPACGAAGTLASALAVMTRFDKAVTTNVYTGILAAHRGQRVIASTMPMVALARSGERTTDQFDVSAAVAFGPHLVSTVALDGIHRATGGPSCGADPSDLPDAGCLLGFPVSLPMASSDDLGELCSKSWDVVLNMPFMVLAWATGERGGPFASGSPDAKWRKIFDWITRPFAGVFCGDISDPTSLISGLKDQTIDRACSDPAGAAKYEDQKKKGESAEDACRRLIGKDADAKGKRRDMIGPRFADIWDPAENGGLFLQSWGLASADRGELKLRLDGAIAVAARVFGASGSVAGGTGPITTFAQSEVFLDCDDNWGACEETAGWTIGYRARLRRVRQPSELVVDEAARLLNRQLLKVGEMNILGQGPKSDLLAHFFVNGGRATSGSVLDFHNWIRPTIGKGTGTAGGWVLERVGEGQNPIIH